jgi:hypothetical protein
MELPSHAVRLLGEPLQDESWQVVRVETDG